MWERERERGPDEVRVTESLIQEEKRETVVQTSLQTSLSSSSDTRWETVCTVSRRLCFFSESASSPQTENHLWTVWRKREARKRSGRCVWNLAHSARCRETAMLWQIQAQLVLCLSSHVSYSLSHTHAGAHWECVYLCSVEAPIGSPQCLIAAGISLWQMDAPRRPQAIEKMLNTAPTDEHVTDLCCSKKPGPVW